MADLSLFLPGFVAAYAILMVGAASPGPAVAFLLGLANAQGRGPALIATTGIACGSACLNLLTLAGVGLLISEAAWAMQILKVIGAGYLLWLAFGAFRKAAHPPQISAIKIAPKSAARHFLAGYLLQVTNPKAIAFWLAIAAVGATAGGNATIIAAFVLGGFFISFACHAFWAVLLSAAPVRRAYAASRRWIEVSLGSFFTFAAYRLATSES